MMLISHILTLLVATTCGNLNYDNFNKLKYKRHSKANLHFLYHNKISVRTLPVCRANIGVCTCYICGYKSCGVSPKSCPHPRDPAPSLTPLPACDRLTTLSQHSFIPHTTSTQASLHESFAHGTKYCNVIEQFKQVIRLNWLLLLGNNNNLCNVHQALIYFLFAHRGITHTKTGTTPSKLVIGG